ncbi:MCE family protein [Lapillicoccus jejuensis]|uniref:Phospholipid/cholesterol/gamma-HCH transport system substrate-binding protein n=1 Tax=Lapillicoccus jejuensis TaxID=402171 RepID=A0A542DWN7_9MICO|nr:MlaD family protein [Lapillicoccus jejuensis]TQJ07509.1 phospholipid/cholesterol/gamma-HCH transport system substrate-binding protein [Lapillicoccus jejuensis]
MRTWPSLVKLVAFAAVTGVAFSVLAATIANVGTGDRSTYRAVFTDVTGLAVGQDVRIAGVRVGEVDEITVNTDRTTALVTFAVATTSALTRSTDATIKYRNLVGERYIALTQGTGSTAVLPPGSTIPVDRTQPALDLTLLFNGFKPLFASLSPKDVNELSGLVIQTLQGEGGGIDDLLGKTASLTSTLADRDAVIGRTIDNLTTVLGTVDAHDDAFKALIDQLQRFISGLSADRKTIGDSLDDINSLTRSTADLLQTARPDVKNDVARLRSLAGNLNKPQNTKTFETFLSGSAKKITTITRTATYGSWFNFYLCRFDTKAPILPNTPLSYDVGGARCTP